MDQNKEGRSYCMIFSRACPNICILRHSTKRHPHLILLLQTIVFQISFCDGRNSPIPETYFAPLSAKEGNDDDTLSLITWLDRLFYTKKRKPKSSYFRVWFILLPARTCCVAVVCIAFSWISIVHHRTNTTFLLHHPAAVYDQLGK